MRGETEHRTYGSSSNGTQISVFTLPMPALSVQRIQKILNYPNTPFIVTYARTTASFSSPSHFFPIMIGAVHPCHRL